MAALGGDAARQPEAVRATFAAGIESLLAALGAGAPTRAETLDMLAHVVGALVMSRACPDDSPLADEILAVCRDRILAAPGLAACAPDAVNR
jgi:TetR/AcrR family transcriptional repressor of nem operon